MANHDRTREAWDQRCGADLAAVGAAIARGEIDEATRKLRAVSLNTSPGSTFSKEVGDLYHELGFEAMAGRYWYLVEQKSDVMVAACQAFEHSLGDSPVSICNSLGWARYPSPYAKTRLEELHSKAAEFRREFQYTVESSNWLRDRVALIGCAIVAFSVLFIFIMGITFIVMEFQ